MRRSYHRQCPIEQWRTQHWAVCSRFALLSNQLSHKSSTGYDIPKGSFCLASLHSLHTDARIWRDPENFRPERYLDYRGNLSTKKDLSLPFGAGRRLCAGETFARNTMFLCIAALLQNFNLKPAGNKLPDINATGVGLTRMPDDFWIRLEAKWLHFPCFIAFWVINLAICFAMIRRKNRTIRRRHAVSDKKYVRQRGARGVGGRVKNWFWPNIFKISINNFFILRIKFCGKALESFLEALVEYSCLQI